MRILVCRPEGGLNDMFCQIQKCIWYCKKFGRSLVLDTQRTRIFCDEWEHYFCFQQTTLDSYTDAFEINDLISRIRPIDVMFPEIFESLMTGRVDFSDALNFHWHGRRLSFDFSMDHAEKALFHHQCGGGSYSHGFLSQICLQPTLVKRLERKLSKLPLFYDGIHCRNTDLKSNLKDFKLPTRKRGVFLATDSYSAQKHFSGMLGNAYLYLSDSELDGDLPLHEQNRPHEQKRLFNENAICDLLALGLSIDLYATNPTSGYSSLATFLNRNPLVILKMLSGNGSSLKTKARVFFSIFLKPSKILKCVQ